MNPHTKHTRSLPSPSAVAERYLAKIRTLEVQESLIAGEIEGTRIALGEARRKVKELLARARTLHREAAAIRQRRAALHD